eukprot:sb/3475304/
MNIITDDFKTFFSSRPLRQTQTPTFRVETQTPANRPRPPLTDPVNSRTPPRMTSSIQPVCYDNRRSSVDDRNYYSSSNSGRSRSDSHDTRQRYRGDYGTVGPPSHQDRPPHRSLSGPGLVLIPSQDLG